MHLLVFYTSLQQTLVHLNMYVFYESIIYWVFIYCYRLIWNLPQNKITLSNAPSETNTGLCLFSGITLVPCRCFCYWLHPLLFWLLSISASSSNAHMHTLHGCTFTIAFQGDGGILLYKPWMTFKLDCQFTRGPTWIHLPWSKRKHVNMTQQLKPKWIVNEVSITASDRDEHSSPVSLSLGLGDVRNRAGCGTVDGGRLCLFALHSFVLPTLVKLSGSRHGKGGGGQSVT